MVLFVIVAFRRRWLSGPRTLDQKTDQVVKLLTLELGSVIRWHQRLAAGCHSRDVIADYAVKGSVLALQDDIEVITGADEALVSCASGGSNFDQMSSIAGMNDRCSRYLGRATSCIRCQVFTENSTTPVDHVTA